MSITVILEEGEIEYLLHTISPEYTDAPDPDDDMIPSSREGDWDAFCRLSDTVEPSYEDYMDGKPWTQEREKEFYDLRRKVHKKREAYIQRLRCKFLGIHTPLMKKVDKDTMWAALQACSNPNS